MILWYYTVKKLTLISSYANSELSSVYAKCFKLFFGFPEYSSMTAMLMQLSVLWCCCVYDAKVVVDWQTAYNCSTAAVVDIVLLFADTQNVWIIVFCLTCLSVCLSVWSSVYLCVLNNERTNEWYYLHVFIYLFIFWRVTSSFWQTDIVGYQLFRTR